MKQLVETDVQPQKFWALIQVYRFFVMGGETWQRHRYQVEGTAHKVNDVDVFVWQRARSHYVVHERSTGGAMCSGKTAAAALATAKALLDETPDFMQQVRRLGDVNTASKITFEEALHWLKVAERKEKAPSAKKKGR